MTTNNFYSEWMTAGNGSYRSHRVFIQNRCSFPTSDDRLIASIASKFVDCNCSDSARVVSVFFDDKSSSHCVTVGSTNAKDGDCQSELGLVLNSIFGSGNIMVVIEIVAPGDVGHDKYNHMEYLSINCGIIGKD